MKKKLLSMLLAMSLLASQTLIASATEITITQDTDLSANPAVATVTATVESRYTVTIPQDLEMSRQEDGSYQCTYNVSVDAEIAENEFISVIPENEILLSTEGKEDVPLTVTQEVQNFRSTYYQGDVSSDQTTVKLSETTTAEGNLSVKEDYKLSAGNWQGTLMFNISLNETRTGPGAYDANDVLLASWDELEAMGFDIYHDYSDCGFNYVMTQNSEKLSNTVKVVIPDGVTDIAFYAFALCGNLTSIEIPESVKTIGGNAFNGCSFKEIILPSSLQTIYGEAFANCTELVSIEIPAGVEMVGEYDEHLGRIYNHFTGCYNLETIYYDGNTTHAPWDAPSAVVKPTSEKQ